MNISLDEDYHKKQVERLANSEEFRLLEKQISQNNVRFGEMPKSLQLAAIYLMTLKADHLIEDINTIFYNRYLPPIEEFLTDEYLGANAKMLFPAWRKEITDLYQPGNTHYELVVGGAIGTGKTTFTNISHEYNLLRICSLREPQLTMGVAPTTVLTLALFSVTKEKSELALIKPFVELLNVCPLFQQVKKKTDFLDFSSNAVTPFIDKGNYLEFPNNIMVYSGSTIAHSISFSLFGASLDEAEFRISGLQDAFETYSNLKERVRSRFLGSRFTLLTLISSAKYTTGVIAKYTKSLKKDDPFTKYIAKPIWEVRSFDAYKKGSFYVLRGTQSNPSKILDEVDEEDYLKGSYKIPNNCEVIKVPKSYKTDFESSLERSLRNLAGVQTLSGMNLFDDLSKIEFDFLIPEFRIEASVSSQANLIDKLPSDLFIMTPNGKRLKRYPSASRYIHLDMAETAEAGLSVVHKEFEEDPEGGKKVIYVADFCCYIVAQDRISFVSIQNLIIDLVKVIQIPVSKITTDQFQSSHMREVFINQKLTQDPKKNIKIQSVDRNIEPYSELSRVVSTRALATGKCTKLKEQLEHVQLDEKDHIMTSIRKDISDSLCGAVRGAMMNTLDNPIYKFVKDPYESVHIDLEEWEEVKT